MKGTVREGETDTESGRYIKTKRVTERIRVIIIKKEKENREGEIRDREGEKERQKGTKRERD